MLPGPIVLSILVGLEEGMGAVLAGIFGFGSLVVMISFFAALIVGTPLYLLLDYLGHASWPIILMLGAGVGVAIGIWLLPSEFSINECLVFSAIGAYGASAYKLGAERFGSAS